jgi:hypothetical protein
MTKTEAIEFIHQSAANYGLNLEDFEKCMLSIPNDLFDKFIYTLYRIAEKSGSDGFDVVISLQKEK